MFGLKMAAKAATANCLMPSELQNRRFRAAKQPVSASNTGHIAWRNKPFQPAVCHIRKIGGSTAAF